MTDEEIEKALAICTNERGEFRERPCELCPYEKYSRNQQCGRRLKMNALDYINRLKAENEDLYFQNQNLQTYIDNHEEIWKRNAEIDKAIVCKHTAKEILQELFGAREFEPLYDCDTSGYVRLKEIKELSKKYGI